MHISRVSDERVESLEALGAAVAVGATVTCRVISAEASAEGLATATMQPSAVGAEVLRAADVAPAQKLRGWVTAVEKWGLVVKIAENVRGTVGNLHLSDAPLVQSASGRAPRSAAFKVGASVVLP